MRRSKLDDDMIEHLALHISEGNYTVTACRLCGISEKTYYEWIHKGHQLPGTIYSRFVKAIDQAEAQRESYLIEEINADTTDWKAAAWLLSRRHPSRWGKQATVKVEL
jgi:hypothetical protein